MAANLHAMGLVLAKVSLLDILQVQVETAGASRGWCGLGLAQCNMHVVM